MTLWQQITSPFERIKDAISSLGRVFNRWFMGAMLLCFGLGFGFLSLIVGRYNSLAHLRGEIIRLQDSLENTGWNIAYDELRFNIWWPLPLMEVDNFTLYSRYAPQREWNIGKLSINTGIFNFHKLQIQLSPQQELVWNDKEIELNFPKLDLSLTYSEDKGITEILASGDGMKFNDYAEIGEFRFGAQQMAPNRLGNNYPFMEIHLLLKNIQLGNQIQTPLTSKIDKLYLNAVQVGALQSQETYQESIFDWLAEDGRFDISELILEWQPLVMVGRGDLYFSEKLEPRLHLSTSSKALISVMELLEEEHIFERKGVFVSRILLKNKAFKMNEQDEFKTVVTPIDYKDNKLLIENIPVASF